MRRAASWERRRRVKPAVRLPMTKGMRCYCGLLLLCLLLGASGCGNTPEKQAAPQKSLQKTSVLFVINVAHGSLTGSGNQTLQVQLQNRSDVWFTDRPVRRSGHLNAKLLMQRWKKSFTNDPPNAVLVIDAQEESVPVTLSSPRLHGNTVTFKATKLPDVPEASTVNYLKSDPSPPRQFRHASLFIDDQTDAQLEACIAQYSARLGLYEARNVCLQESY
jgi:hypothetical protein